jgi:poly-gamma-glutamate synthesis protein (capsule biosynthesis protein)
MSEMVCIGVGENSARAEKPRLVQVGPVRIGFAGMDTTMTCFAARQDQAGTHYAPEDDALRVLTEKIKKMSQWAESRCDLLILTIHWGKNWAQEVPAVHRSMARIAFDHGVDLLLGHSAHCLQGIEIVDGKAAVYDMGNLLFDCELRPEGRQCALFRIHLSTAGVHKIEVLPIQVLEGHTVLAAYEDAHQTISEMQRLCQPFATDLSMAEDLEGRPLGVIHVSKPRRSVRGEPDRNLTCVTFPAREAEIPATVDSTFLTDQIPADAQNLSPPVELARGVELIA